MRKKRKNIDIQQQWNLGEAVSFYINGFFPKEFRSWTNTHEQTISLLCYYSKQKVAIIWPVANDEMCMWCNWHVFEQQNIIAILWGFVLILWGWQFLTDWLKIPYNTEIKCNLPHIEYVNINGKFFDTLFEQSSDVKKISHLQCTLGSDFEQLYAHMRICHYFCQSYSIKQYFHGRE